MHDSLPKWTLRQARLKDIELLDKHLPPFESPTEHRDRLRSQDAGEADYLIAWAGRVPVGHIMVRWTGFRFGPLPKLFPNTPVLLRLRIWPPERRGQGIGTALIEAAERAAVDRHYESIGLIVDIDNERALRLYERVGYVDWGGGTFYERTTQLDADGNTVAYDQVFTVQTKRLAT